MSMEILKLSCQHCYKEIYTDEFICQHCRMRGNPDIVCEACIETVHEYHDNDGFVTNCDDCYWEIQ